MTKRHLETNEAGHLTIGGCDTVALAQKYGTPLYVMDGDQIEANMQICMQAMAEAFSSYKVFYASKAIITKAICKMAQKHGLHLDVVSEFPQIHCRCQCPPAEIYIPWLHKDKPWRHTDCLS